MNMNKSVCSATRLLMSVMLLGLLGAVQSEVSARQFEAPISQGDRRLKTIPHQELVAHSKEEQINANRFFQGGLAL